MNSDLLATETDRLGMDDHVTANGVAVATNGVTVATNGVTIAANGHGDKTRTTDQSEPVTNSPSQGVSSKAALATVMDFSMLSNSTVMLIDVIQEWRIAGTEPIRIILLILLPIVMLIQLPVAVMLILSSHGNFDKPRRNTFHTIILALLSISAGLMLVADLLKVRTDAMFSASVLQSQLNKT